MLDPGEPVLREPVLWRKLWNGAVVRAQAERMISVLAADGPPFCESEWLGWRPHADWTIPALPEDWAH